VASPGQYGRGRIFYYNSIMATLPAGAPDRPSWDRALRAGAYLPALSDVIFMVEGTSFMGWGAEPVEGADGPDGGRGIAGGAATHTA